MDLLDKTQCALLLTAGNNFAQKKYVLGVSGGKDSQCLLHLFSQLIPKENLHVVHVNYRLRGKDSSQDEKLVKDSCVKSDISFSVFTPDVTKSSEASLRNLRREIFKSVLKETGFDYIVLGHHAQDQLETILMRLIRGTGQVGLAGMKKKNGSYIRPLLEITPLEIDTYLKEHQIAYRTDHTNFESRYFRNEIRQELIPVLEKISSRHGGAFSLYNKTSKLSEELHSTNTYLEKKNKRTYKKLVSENTFWFRFSQTKFLKLDKVAQAHFLHLLFCKLKVTPDRETLVRALKSIEAGKDLSLPEGAHLSVSCEQVFFQNKKQIFRLSKIKGPLSLGVSFEIPEGLELRFPKAGDRFRSGKLKKKMLEERIPRLMRKVLPVLAQCGTNEVVWYLKA